VLEPQPSLENEHSTVILRFESAEPFGTLQALESDWSALEKLPSTPLEPFPKATPAHAPS
jgi:hypothetical protein